MINHMDYMGKINPSQQDQGEFGEFQAADIQIE